MLSEHLVITVLRCDTCHHKFSQLQFFSLDIFSPSQISGILFPRLRLPCSELNSQGFKISDGISSVFE